MKKAEKIILSDNQEINLDVLLDTRMLIQANSGGGKSWCIRRILEQSHGKLQQIVIDLEGEFSTLREKHDYVLAGKDGDTPAEPRSAALLAKRLLELNVSAIIDLYELDHYERKRFVKNFLDALVNAPKELWHPCLVVVDEAHVFCPEKGQSEASGSVIDLATRGRKRGFCAVLATQRLSKLHKDAAAECNNKLIGRTGLDVDMKRASEELGFTSKEQYLSLRSLSPGEFFAFGPAMNVEVAKVKIGDVKTTHPKAGSRIVTAPPVPPTKKIKEILGKLSDLPKEAEKEAQTLEELKQKNRELQRKLTISEKSDVKTDPKIAEGAIETAMMLQEKELNKLFTEKLVPIRNIADKLAKLGQEVLSASEVLVKAVSTSAQEQLAESQIEKKMEEVWRLAQTENKLVNNQDLPIDGLPLACRKIYSFLYINPDRFFSKTQLGLITGYSPRSGGFNNALSKLNSLNLLTKNGTDIGLGRLEPQFADVKSMRPLSIELWLEKLPRASSKILQILLDNPNSEFSKEKIGEMIDYSSSSGGFNNALSKLNALGLIERIRPNVIRLNQELLEI
jgi:hypothetical protein